MPWFGSPCCCWQSTSSSKPQAGAGAWLACSPSRWRFWPAIRSASITRSLPQQCTRAGACLGAATVADPCRPGGHVARRGCSCGRATATRLGCVTRKRAKRRSSLRRCREFLVPAGELDYAPGSRLLRRHGASGLLGRWYLWEMSVFIGATGLVLAGYGAVCGERPLRRFGAPMVLLLLLLALGNYTPLYRFLYDYVPGFGRFRSISKFVFFAAVFLAMLAGVGLDRLIRRPRGDAPAGGNCRRPRRTAGSDGSCGGRRADGRVVAECGAARGGLRRELSCP